MSSQLPVFEEPSAEGKVVRGVLVGDGLRLEVDDRAKGTAELATLSLDQMRTIARRLTLRFGLVFNLDEPGSVHYADSDGLRVSFPCPSFQKPTGTGEGMKTAEVDRKGDEFVERLVMELSRQYPEAFRFCLSCHQRPPCMHYSMVFRRFGRWRATPGRPDLGITSGWMPWVEGFREVPGSDETEGVSQMSEYHAESPKREKRRQLREKEFGPERRIVSSCGEAHVLECGHRVLRMATELPHIKRRRCEYCRVSDARKGQV